LTGSGDSAPGALETIRPALDSISVPPESGITATFSEPMLAPGVTAPGNYAVSGAGAGTLNANPDGVSGSGPYTLTWAAGEMRDGEAVTLTATGVQDAAGNLGGLEDTAALEIVEGAPEVPVRWWPAALALLLAGTAVLALRKRGQTRLRSYLAAFVSARAFWFLLMAALLAAPAALAQGPTVTNAAFVQQDNGAGGTEVVITYDLDAPNGPCDITVSLSKDGGADGFVHPVTSVTGDLVGVTTGTDHSITWEIAADYPDEDIPNAVLRVTADDGFPEMISMAENTFTMGRRDDGDDGTHGGNDELPRHAVTLSAYEIGRYEVTNQQVCDVFNQANASGRFDSIGETAQAFGQPLFRLNDMFCNLEYVEGLFVPKTRAALAESVEYSMGDHPAVMITWYGAVAFSNWLSEFLGLEPVYDTATWEADFSKNGYHLPTEAQWEYAAAWEPAGDKHWIYGFESDTLSGKDRANYIVNTTPEYVNPLELAGLPYTAPAGWFNGINRSPNGNVQTLESTSPAGCYDMSGNVAELCHDRFDSAYYTISPASDPAGPATGTDRAVRGGGWDRYAEYCRSADRQDFGPDCGGYAIGFRLARTLMTAPSVDTFAIDGGAVSTADPVVTLDNTCSGVPMEYMASEAPDFSGATWQTWDTAPGFTLSTGGTRTVYFKVRNAAGESAPVSDTTYLILEQTIMLPGDVPLELVWVPSGSFQMGRYTGEQDSDSREDPQHSVTVSCFWMGKYELTKAQWTAVKGTTPWSGQGYVLNDSDSAAVYVSWYDAQSFISDLNAHIVSSGQGPVTVRLPSEAEWEYACRAGTTTRFYWGDDSAHTVGGAYCWWRYNARDAGEAYAHAAGLKTGNAFELYDMSGNVYEWCEDDWHWNYTGAPADGSAWVDSPRAGHRVFRGGCWLNDGSYCRSAYRRSDSTSYKTNGIGFRLAADE
jgi:formylglycine-generating enzyme required for sulfatase activity